MATPNLTIDSDHAYVQVAKFNSDMGTGIVAGSGRHLVSVSSGLPASFDSQDS